VVIAMNRRELRSWPDWERREDRELWDYYAHHILEPGWAGDPSDAQVLYIQGVLTKKIKSPYFRRGARLRHLWGFGSAKGEMTASAIHEVAMSGDPDDPIHNAELVRKAGHREVRDAVQLPLWIHPQEIDGAAVAGS